MYYLLIINNTTTNNNYYYSFFIIIKCSLSVEEKWISFWSAESSAIFKNRLKTRLFVSSILITHSPLFALDTFHRLLCT